MGLFQNLGAVALVTIFALSGLMKVQDPAQTAKQIMSGSLPWVLNENAATKLAQFIPGFAFTVKEATLLAQAIGAVMVFSALMVIVNLGRRVFGFVLVGVLGAITLFQHIDLKDPSKTTLEHQIHCLKNLAIIGGLLYVMGTDESASYRAAQYERAIQANANATSRKAKAE